MKNRCCVYVEGGGSGDTAINLFDVYLCKIKSTDTFFTQSGPDMHRISHKFPDTALNGPIQTENFIEFEASSFNESSKFTDNFCTIRPDTRVKHCFYLDWPFIEVFR